LLETAVLLSRFHLIRLEPDRQEYHFNLSRHSTCDKFNITTMIKQGTSLSHPDNTSRVSCNQEVLGISQIEIYQIYKAKMARRPARPAPARRAEALSAAPVEAGPAAEPDSDPVAEADPPKGLLV
jgi:hypothetical protein